LIRAPLVDFRAAEVELDAFGYNIANADLAAVFRDSISSETADCATVNVFDQTCSTAATGGDAVDLTLADGTEITAALAIAADGRRSILREAACIATTSWSYPQSAIVLNFSHLLPHHGVSVEFHTETGPFTTVPLPAQTGAPNRSSLVWVVAPGEVERVCASPVDQLNRDVESRMQSIFGAVAVQTKPATFPLSGMSARDFARQRVALVGEAAHVFPPIGAQGFNLGLRDVDVVCTLAADAVSRGADCGSEAVIRAYDRQRRGDVLTRTGAVDLLNRSLLADFLPVQAVRAGGLFVLSVFPWLRQQIMRRGLAHRG
jgi:2-octaprenyl-6-methoxyphenol hydroxylase